MFLGLPDRDLYPLVGGMDPDPAPDPFFSRKCVERPEMMPAKLNFNTF
jgi:hypothetical protein